MDNETIWMWTSIISSILVSILLGGLFAALTTRVAGMFVDFPFTWSNVGKVYLAFMLIVLLRVWWGK